MPVRPASIRATLDGIGHVVRDLKLAVPPFQRSYSWRIAQVETFWEDLRAAQRMADPEYFLGTIVLTPGDDQRMTIIDGQQRLATTSMLFAAIRDAFIDADDPERASVIQNDYIAVRSLRSSELEPRLVLNEDDRDFYVEYIVEGTAVDAEHSSHRRLAAAYDYLRRVMDDEVTAGKEQWDDILYRWTSFLDVKVQVIVLTADSEADSFLIFETLNDRGLSLTVSDLLKNYLFSLGRDDLETIQGHWLAAVSALEIAGEETVTPFLRHYWSSLYGATRERELYREIKRYVRSGPAAIEFASDLEDTADDYAALLDPDAEYWTIAGTGTSEAVAVLLMLGLEQNRPLLLAAMAHFSPVQLRRLLHALVGWSVRGLVVGGIGGGTTERYYADAAVRIRRGKLRDAQSVLHVLAPIVAGDEAFYEAFRRVAIPRSQVARYLLIALERQAKNRRHPALPTANDRRSYTVEPILPPSATEREWPAFEGEEITAWVRRLGNLALLPRESEALHRRPWSGRKEVLAKTEIELNAAVAKARGWTPRHIERRQRDFADRALAIWPRNPPA